jgi:hypothetical protein
MSISAITTYDPRKAIWDDISIETWDAGKWKQWKAKSTGDSAKIEREYLRLKHGVEVANSALRLERVKIKLKLTTCKSIGLQGTFPCKAGDVGKNGSSNKQYTISLGFTANDVGLKAAVAKARELDLLLVTKQFQWTTELLGKQAQKLDLAVSSKLETPIQQLIAAYEEEFWKTHEKTVKELELGIPTICAISKNYHRVYLFP